jgi:bifunctional DNA-binding transcriptional regulator/antitoxin component of YhaV-PrlF toxin-antitoxin module
MQFRAEVRQGGKTATGIVVPDEIVEALGKSRKPAVKVTIRGFTYRTSIASMGGRFMLPVSADVRARAGVAGGDTVDIQVELDTEPRSVAVPADFAAALDANAVARGVFDGLAYSHRLRHVLAIEGAKAEDTRKRRIEKAVAMLAEGRAV